MFRLRETALTAEARAAMERPVKNFILDGGWLIERKGR